MILRLATASGQTVHGPFNTDILPAAGAIVRTPAGEFVVSDRPAHHDCAGGPGSKPIVTVLVEPVTAPTTAGKAHGKRALHG